MFKTILPFIVSEMQISDTVIELTVHFMFSMHVRANLAIAFMGYFVGVLGLCKSTPHLIIYFVYSAVVGKT